MVRPLVRSAAVLLLGLPGVAAAGEPITPGKPAAAPLPPDRRMTAYAAADPAAQPPKPADPAPPAAQPVPLPRRLEGLSAPAAAPQPTPETLARFGRYVDRVVDADNTLDLLVGRSRLLLLKAAPGGPVELTDPTVARVTTVSPRQLSIVGLKAGTATLTLQFIDPADAADDAIPPAAKRREILSYVLRVLPDPEFRRRQDATYEALALEVNRAFPDSAIKLQLVGDKLVLSGHAKDVHDAYQILRVVRANAPQPDGGARAAAVGPLPDLGGGVVPAGGVPDLREAGGADVINLLRVGGEHQVMLKVTVAEVNRAAARSVGVNFTVARKDGLVVFANRTGNIAGTVAGGAGSGGGGGVNGGGVGAGALSSAAANLPTLLSGGQVAAAIDALRTLNFAKSLAEPNLTTLNGRPASFQAGGQFPVPVVTGFTAAGLQGVSFVPFGVGLQFTPVVTDDDRVRLTVAADVSTRDASTASTNIGGAAVPSLTTRNFQTTVELRSGETLAVAGLIQTNFGSDAARVPLLGDLPVVGRLFAFDRTSNADQELVVLITPTLVHPLGPGVPLPLPGCELLPPGDIEFYLLGHLQRHWGGVDKTLMDPAAARKVHRLEKKLLVGPVGHSTGP